MSGRDRRWLALLVALPVLVHLPELTGVISSDPLLLVSGLGLDVPDGVLLSGQPGWIDGNAGVTVQALGRLVARDWLHGIVPWWNPYSGVGAPLAGEYQPAAFFLPFVLLLGLPNGVLLLKLSLQIAAGLGGWGLGRRLGFHRPVAATAGLLFAFGGGFGWASDAPIQPMAFLPLILLGIEHARRPGPATWLPLGLGLGLSLLAGFPETAFLDGLPALGWALLRLASAGPDRPALAFRLGLAGTFALLLAAPQLVAFLEFLPDAFVGSHAGGLVETPLPAAGFAMWLMPWLHGPMFLGGHPDLWFTLGGYLGAAPTLLALVALGGRRERGLRLLLGCWAVLVAGKSAALWPLAAIADAIPLMGHTIVSRYATPSLSMALVVLACFAIEDWLAAPHGLRRRRLIAVSCMFAALVAVCLVAAWPVSRSVARLPGGRLAWGLSLALLALTATCLVALLHGAPTRRRLGTALAIMSIEALLLFTVPLLSGRTGGHLDTGTLAFLRGHLGLQRFTTLGRAFNPNYGAYWGIASINHNLIPVPRAWTDALHDDVDPDIDLIKFYGADGGSVAGIARRARALLPHMDMLASFGVRYLLQDHGDDHFAIPALPEPRRHDAGWTGLAAGGTLDAHYPPGSVPALRVTGLSVVVGTFVGHADGTLLATLCSGTDCAQGSARLDGAVDDAALPIGLDRTLPVRPDLPLALTLAHPSGSRVAIWLWHGDGAGTSDGLPRLRLRSADAPVLVHVGASADIYALAHPAPYADAGPGCLVDPASRTRMTVSCATPSRLVRREMFLPGWQVRVGKGGWRPVERDGALFQAVPLPAGRSTLRFAYAPPHAAIGWCGLLLALAMAAGSGGGLLLGHARHDDPTPQSVV